MQIALGAFQFQSFWMGAPLQLGWRGWVVPQNIFAVGLTVSMAAFAR